jgi:uncharacterized repeat protein (TIGR01451 family)
MPQRGELEMRQGPRRHPGRSRKLPNRPPAGIRSRRLALTLALALICALLLPISAAHAVVNLAAIPNFPTIVTAGQTGVAGTMTLLNGSTGSQATGTVTLQSITMVPSCLTFVPGCPGAGDADPGTFTLSSTGTGRTDTGCAGMSFNIAVTNASTGEVTFQGGPVVLQAPSIANELDSCVIDFTFTVNRQPNHDSLPLDPGTSTNQLGHVTGQHQDGTSASADGQDVTTINPGTATPTIATQASPSVPVGGQITDTGTLSGGTNPTGTITFTLFGPNDLTCSGTPAFTSTKTVSGNGSVTSDPFTPTAAGAYSWRAAYSGDANNPAAGPTACVDPAEAVVVTPVIAGPTLGTTASASVAVGGQITDTATLAGGTIPTGTITFTLFGPNDATCSGTPAFTSTKTVSGNGNVTSDPFTPTAPGTYLWRAAYSGDAINGAASTACNDPGESVVVTSGGPNPTLTTTASISPGGQITDSATLAGGTNPTGTITFTLFGPNDLTCSGTPAFTSTKTVSGNAGYTSDPFTPTAPGTYRWIAAYSGDANNNGASTACNDPGETVATPVVSAPTLTTAASPSVAVGGQITDTATLEDFINPTGTITFTLFGPGNVTCAGMPTFTNQKTVAGNVTTSDPFTPAAPGTYRWMAAYSGDANNSAASTACNDPGESVVVTGLPTMTVVKTASPPTLPEPGGAFTFAVAVNNPSSVPVVITSIKDDVYKSPDIDSPTRAGSTCDDLLGDTVAPGGSGACTFTATFTGNAGATQTDVVQVVAVDSAGNQTAATDDATVSITNLVPTVGLDVDAIPPSLPEPGGDFTFSVKVTNTSNETLTTTSLTDTLLGNLNGKGTCATGVTVTPGASYNCSFVFNFTGNGGASLTDSVTVVARDDDAVAAKEAVFRIAQLATATATDQATITITGVAPTILVQKDASPASLPEPGGTFTFFVRIINTSAFESVVLTSLTDNVHGNLNGMGNCATGATIAAGGGSYLCSFTASFTGQAGATQTDTVSATVTDDDGQTATGDDPATVLITPRGTPPGAVFRPSPPGTVFVPQGQGGGLVTPSQAQGPTVVGVNNNSSSSSSAAASAGGGATQPVEGRGGASGGPAAVPGLLARTGIESLPLSAAAINLIVLGMLLLQVDRDHRRRRRVLVRR